MSALLEVEMMQKIGFIGLGIMGTPMARLLLKAGYQVNIYARTDVHVKPLAEEGGIARQTPKEIAEHSDVIITMLPDSRVVEEVLPIKPAPPVTMIITVTFELWSQRQSQTRILLSYHYTALASAIRQK